MMQEAKNILIKMMLERIFNDKYKCLNSTEEKCCVNKARIKETRLQVYIHS